MQRFVNVVIPPISQSFTYCLDPAISSEVKIGSQVNVSFGRRHTRGFVVSELSSTQIDTKLINLKTIGSEGKIRQCFDRSDLEFFQWVSEYYGESLANIIDAAIPSPARHKVEFSAQVIKTIPPEEIKSKPQKAIYEYLLKSTAAAGFSELKSVHKSAPALTRKLEEQGLIKIYEQEVLDRHISSEAAPLWAKSKVELNEKQQDALRLINKSIKDRNPTPVLLHGITGSGKTEVYIEAIQKCIEMSLGVLILVPEISLTPQLVDRFRARLGNQIAVLHSALHKNIRWDSWRALLEKRNFVAIGARSAVFAPVPNLGLIVIDEEHDSSYKQSDGLRYNARDIAIMRAKIMKCPIILGSATPSLETFNNALQKKFFYKPLPARHNAAGDKKPVPVLDIKISDLTKIKLKDMPSKNISPLLLENIKQTLEKNGQIFILYNRRGFASYFQCNACGDALSCPYCSVTLTFHKKDNILLCHYCNLSKPAPKICPSCSKGELDERGSGTEKVYDELKELLPGTVIDRLDRDTVTNLDTYRSILNNVRNGKTQILVGTQMIAKGHDLPGVTLVGIIDCDTSLNFPDFRSAEKTFQLLTQAAGRAGRGDVPGKVILQTRLPKHHSIATTVMQNYLLFAETELKNRKDLNYPPFCRLVRIIASAPDKQHPSAYLQNLQKRIAEMLGSDISKVSILGPAAAPLEKIKNHWRSHLLIKGKSITALNKIVRIAFAAKAKTKKIKITVDVDPQDML